MIIRFFENTKPYNFLFCYGISVLYMLIYNLVIFTEKTPYELLSTIVGMSLLLFVYLLIINFLCLKNNFCEGNRYPIFFSVSIMAFFPRIYTDISVMGAIILILIALHQLLYIKNTSNQKKVIFDASLLICCSCLLFNWTIICIILVWIACFLYTFKQIMRNIFIPFIAFFAISILTFAILILFGKIDILKDFFTFQISFNLNKYLHISYTLPLVFMIVMSFFSLLLYIILKKKPKTIFPRFLLIILLVETIILIISEEKNTSEMILLNTPIALFLGICIEIISKKWLKNIILWSFIIVPFIVLGLHWIEK